ncbi:hypothetical protein K466DRAFT_497173 [Polyporus arcularius HHB13444]|uniref:Uncharacterized protein n=1 Tax=Polyporus arcularius HHB13444 TaxID=1314778 RepID=A0A5C3P540_9APHY|nr:hypothetical protein K466DRAFT_497173 [Polyporus arcularius HHB13444]
MAQAPQHPPTFCKLDEYGVQHAPGYKPMTKEELEMYHRAMGATDETMQEYMDAYDRDAEAALGPSGPGVRMIGMKPRPDDDNVYTVPIQGTDLIIRMWEGGMAAYSHFCLDFFDTRQQTPVNLPRGYAICPASANMPGVFTRDSPLPSWERAYGYTPANIPPGEEKWSVPAGSYLSVFKGRHELVTFAVPQTQAHQDMMARIVQPTRRYRA